MADKLSGEPVKKKGKTKDVEAQAERVRAKKFSNLTDTQWNEMVDDKGIKLKDWVQTVVASNRKDQKKFGPTLHKQALKRWPILARPSESLPKSPDDAGVDRAVQKKLESAIGKFREKNPASRTMSSIQRFSDETVELHGYLLHGLICEM